MTLETFLQIIRNASDGSLTNASAPVLPLLLVVGCLSVIASLAALNISIVLALSYIKHNRKENRLGLDGEQIARKVLELNDLQNIRVSATGSILFGNSYSHYFKKVRLRRLTWHKKSVSVLALSVQKSSLAMLDKENDPDMRKRVALTSCLYLGPVAFVLLGVLCHVDPGFENRKKGAGQSH